MEANKVKNNNFHKKKDGTFDSTTLYKPTKNMYIKPSEKISIVKYAKDYKN